MHYGHIEFEERSTHHEDSPYSHSHVPRQTGGRRQVVELRLPSSIQSQGDEVPLELLSQKQKILPALNNNKPLDLLTVVRVKVGDLGSKTYHTQVGTLLQFPETLLAEIVTPPFPFYDAVKEVHVLPEGIVDPDTFGIILDYLRSGAWQPILNRDSYDLVCAACSSCGLPAFPRNPSTIGTELLTGGMAGFDHGPTDSTGVGLRGGMMVSSPTGNRAASSHLHSPPAAGSVGLDYYSPGGGVVVGPQAQQLEEVTSSRGYAMGVRSSPRKATATSGAPPQGNTTGSRSPSRGSQHRSPRSASFLSPTTEPNGASDRYEHIEVEVPLHDSALHGALREYSLQGFRIVAEKKGRSLKEAATRSGPGGAQTSDTAAGAPGGLYRTSSEFKAPKRYDNGDDHFDDHGKYIENLGHHEHHFNGKQMEISPVPRTGGQGTSHYSGDEQPAHDWGGQYSTVVTMRRKISPLENMNTLLAQENDTGARELRYGAGRPPATGRGQQGGGHPIDWSALSPRQPEEDGSGGRGLSAGSTSLADQAAALKFIQNSS